MCICKKKTTCTRHITSHLTDGSTPSATRIPPENDGPGPLLFVQSANLLPQATFWALRHKWLSSHPRHQRAHIWWGWRGNSSFKPRCLSQDRRWPRGSRTPEQEPLSFLPLKLQAGRGGGTHACTTAPGKSPDHHWWGAEPWSRESLTDVETLPTVIRPSSLRKVTGSRT